MYPIKFREGKGEAEVSGMDLVLGSCCDLANLADVAWSSFEIILGGTAAGEMCVSPASGRTALF